MIMEYRHNHTYKTQMVPKQRNIQTFAAAISPTVLERFLETTRLIAGRLLSCPTRTRVVGNQNKRAWATVSGFYKHHINQTEVNRGIKINYCNYSFCKHPVLSFIDIECTIYQIKSTRYAYI